MREALGVVASEKYGVFSSAQTNKLAMALRQGEGDNIDNKRDAPVFVVIDPTGGGSSKLAMISV